MVKDGVHGVVPHCPGTLAAPVGVYHHQQPPGPVWQLLQSCPEPALPVHDHLLTLRQPCQLSGSGGVLGRQMPAVWGLALRIGKR